MYQEALIEHPPLPYYDNAYLTLAIRGGYLKGCANRVLDPTNTVLDGNLTGTVLSVVSGYLWGTALLIEGVTLQNGGSDGLYLGLDLETTNDSAIKINKSIFKANKGRGIRIQNPAWCCTGRIEISQNDFLYNEKGGMHIVPSMEKSGTVLVLNNKIIGNLLNGGLKIWNNAPPNGPNTVVSENIMYKNKSQSGGG